MRISLVSTTAAISAAILLMAGCAVPNSGYYSLSAAQSEENRLNTERIERIGRDQEHSERMGRAEAAEIATRNAPTSVSTTQIYAPHNY